MSANDRPCNDRRWQELADGALCGAEAEQAALHLQACADCSEAYGSHQTYLQMMAAVKAPVAAVGTHARLLRNARARHEQRGQHRSGFVRGFAAASLLAMVLGLWLVSGEQTPDSLIAEWTLEERDIDLVINVPTDMPGARLSISIPEQLELVGYDGTSTLSWEVDLHAGANVLTLPVRVVPGTDLSQPLAIDAMLSYRDMEKGFQIGVALDASHDQRGARLRVDPPLGETV